jgi:hypothetical protein
MKRNLLILSSVLALLFGACSKDKDFQQLKETKPTTNTVSAEKTLAYGYWVTAGSVASYNLEPAATEGSWTHYVLNMTVNGQPYQNMINMYKRNPNLNPTEYMSYRIAKINPADFSYITGLADGQYQLPSNKDPNAATGGALDFVRSQSVLKNTQGYPWISAQLIINSTTIPTFDNLFANADRVWVFGEKFHYGGNGTHDIHQNQGNIPDPIPANDFTYLNGTWQDGGVIVKKTEIVGIKKIGTYWIPIFGPVYYMLNTHFAIEKEFTDVNGNGIDPAYTYSQNLSVGAGKTYYIGPFYYNAQKVFELTNCTGNPDLYVLKGNPPTTSVYSGKSANATGDEYIRVYDTDCTSLYTSCYFIMIYGNSTGTSTFTVKMRAANSL